MEKSSFLLKVLQILALEYTASCSLEELTELVIPLVNNQKLFIDYSLFEKETQAGILDALLFLNAQGFIFLNFDNNRSIITIKGLITIENRVLYN